MTEETVTGRMMRLIRNEVIEECAKLCGELRRKDYSGENEDWIAGTADCAVAIRSLARLDFSTAGTSHIEEARAALALSRAPRGIEPRSTMKLEIIEPSERHAGPILVCDEANNDIAEFFHNEQATVGQSYETALLLANALLAASLALSSHEQGTENG